MAAGAPMRSPEWLLGWWEQYATPADSLHIILVFDSEKNLVGLAPLYQQQVSSNKTLQGLGARDNCSHHLDWLSIAGWETRVGAAVARHLFQDPQSWKKLLLEAVDADATAIHATLNHLTGHGCLGHQRQINSGWKINLPDCWDDYLQMLSASLRKRCRKLQRQFFDSGKIRVHMVEREVDLREGFEVLLKLHAARWGNARQPLGVFSDPKFRSFHETVAKALLADRKLRLAWLEREGKPIAVEYQFFDADAVYAYQAGIDLAAHECEPGKLSMMAAIRFAIERGCRSFDLLGGDEPYKTHWRAEPVARHDLRVWRRSLSGYLEWLLWHAYTMVAGRLKAHLPERLSRRLAKLLPGN